MADNRLLPVAFGGAVLAMAFIELVTGGFDDWKTVHWGRMALSAAFLYLAFRLGCSAPKAVRDRYNRD
ncbi:unannotated protein [freshwater metagenome]|uniref:Unannotated protein n=1 Tax=freshwater metagenome TaxID=449393 RepID=A0A6J5ZR52_9ZZZZ